MIILERSVSGICILIVHGNSERTGSGICIPKTLEFLNHVAIGSKVYFATGITHSGNLPKAVFL